jgi:hypothetical protein
MPNEILKPLSEDQLKNRVEEFVNIFIILYKSNKLPLSEIKENYQKADQMLYQLLKGSNGIVDSVRLLDILHTLIVNFLLETNLNGNNNKFMTEPDKKFICFLGYLILKYSEPSDGKKRDKWIYGIINNALRKKW